MCGECEYHLEDCLGCEAIKGIVFWLQVTGDAMCPIYQCVEEKRLERCGLCTELPCGKYDLGDPAKSAGENAAGMERQLAHLRSRSRRTE